MRQSGKLAVGDGHEIYWEEHGAADGRPAVVLHGGPGGGLQRSVLRFFDLRKWRIILFDQRGCGRSTPYLGLRANTTWHLVADIEALRSHLEIPRWLVFGGSWGSTLALAYVARHPRAVTGLILRGIFLGEPWETAWLYEEGGASRIRPVEWERFAETCKGSSRRLTACYRKRLANKKTRKAAARAWWDMLQKQFSQVAAATAATLHRNDEKGAAKKAATKKPTTTRVAKQATTQATKQTTASRARKKPTVKK